MRQSGCVHVQVEENRGVGERAKDDAKPLQRECEQHPRNARTKHRQVDYTSCLTAFPHDFLKAKDEQITAQYSN